MKSNIEKYKTEINALVENGEQLQNAMSYECSKVAFEKAAKEALGNKADKFIADLPEFETAYQKWYSEAHAVIKQLVHRSIHCDFLSA